MSKYYLFLIFICNSFLSFSQTPIYFTIGEKEFENTDVYSVLFDEDTELIYAGTNRGLFVYRQNKFIKLKAPKDHIGTSFFDLKQDNKGAIFCSNFNGQIFKINKKDNSYKLYYEIDNFNSKGSSVWFYFDKKNNLIIAGDYFFRIIDNHKTVILDGLPNKMNSAQILGCKQIEKDIYIETNKKNENIWETFQIKDTLFVIKDQFKTPANSKFGLERTSYLSKYKGQLYSINMEGMLMNNDYITSNYQQLERERFFYLNDSSFIALNSQNGYRYFYLKNDTISTSQLLMPQTFISSFYKTKDNKHLLGTFGEGIIVINYPKTNTYQHEYLFTDIACSPQNEVAISARSGEIFKLDKNNQIKMVDKALSNVDRIWYSGKNKLYKAKGFNNFIYYNSRKKAPFIRDLKIINDSITLFTEWTGISIIVPDNIAIKSNLAFTPPRFKINNLKGVLTSVRCNLIEYDNRDSLIYFSNNLGVHSKKWSRTKTTPLTFNSKPFNATDLLMYKSLLFCGTSKNGIIVYKDTKYLYQINKQNGLKSDNVIQLIAKGNILYILTENGLQLYDLITKKIIQTDDRYTYRGVIRFAISNDKLWLVTKHSYFSIDFNAILNSSYIKKTPTLYLGRIKVNNNVIQKNKVQSYKHHQNHFEFEYDYRDVFTKKEAKIHYTLEGFHQGWKEANTFNHLITFESLPPGEYNFKIKATLKNEQSKTISFPFKISFPFWQTWWFYLLLIIIIIGIISFFFLVRINKIKKENLENLEKQKLISNSLDSELKAIRSQMNPHFIFNAINSIQDLVLQKDTLQSYDSLVQFSKLVRNTLNYSEQEYISINQEVDFLKNYLDLEKLRFRDQFAFEIKNKTNKELKIPSLVVQPFVENAIKHGLLHKSGPKTLQINFNCIDEIIICTVKDNGIGRLKAKEIKSRQKGFHKSFSTNAIKKRLEVLTQKNGIKYHYEILDILNNSQEIIGTEVKIYLPLIKTVDTVAKKKPTVK